MTKFDTFKFTNQGAHLFHWQPAFANEPVLFCSEKAVFMPGKAIRGGVPICWPWFGFKADHAQHGFARTSDWRLEKDTISDYDHRVQLSLSSNLDTKALFPYEFKLTLDIIENQNDLLLSLTTINCDQKPFPITAALHTYFQVGDIHQVNIVGLQDSTFIDKLDNEKIKTESDHVLKINGEIDRIYLSSDTTKIIDSSLKRIITIDHNASSIVIWNPWIDKSKTIADLTEHDYKKFICIESAIMPHQKTLMPGQSFSLEQNIKIEKM